MLDEKNASKIPPGWVLQKHVETFSGQAGPYYFRDIKSAEPGVGFVAEKRHTNLQGFIHGGALMTLADMSLFDICFRALGRFRGVTLSMTHDFIGAGEVGDFIEASGEVTKSTGGVLFARGLVTANGQTLLSFSGSLKRLREK